MRMGGWVGWVGRAGRGEGRKREGMYKSIKVEII